MNLLTEEWRMFRLKSSVRRFSFIGLLGLLCIASGPSHALFVGPYDVSNWTETKSGSPPAGGGDVNTSGAPVSITFFGGNSDCSGGPCNLDFTIPAVAAGNVLFDWVYLTTDADGPGFDDWGFLLNGAFTQLSSNGGANAQAGSESFPVLAGDIFGFRLDCTDCEFGPADITVSNFSVSAAVPEPATLALLGMGLAGLVFARRRRS